MIFYINVRVSSSLHLAFACACTPVTRSINHNSCYMTACMGLVLMSSLSYKTKRCTMSATTTVASAPSAVTTAEGSTLRMRASHSNLLSVYGAKRNAGSPPPEDLRSVPRWWENASNPNLPWYCVHVARRRVHNSRQREQVDEST